MVQRGLRLKIATICNLAQLWLSVQLPSSKDATIGENWVNHFINWHDQQAKCKGPELIRRWFQQAHDTIQQYGILAEDIYNMDETGFQMGYISTSKVICSAEIHARENARIVLI